MEPGRKVGPASGPGDLPASLHDTRRSTLREANERAQASFDARQGLGATEDSQVRWRDRALAERHYAADLPATPGPPAQLSRTGFTVRATEGDATALLDFQRAESLAFVGACDAAVVEHLFEAFDVDCDNVLSRAEGEKLLLTWLRDAQVHLPAVLHSLVAGLVACKISTALALSRDLRADSWGAADTSAAGFAYDEDVESS